MKPISEEEILHSTLFEIFEFGRYYPTDKHADTTRLVNNT